MGHATLRPVPPALYAELTPWYHLVDPPEDHADEASCFLDALAGAIAGPSATLLELGAGAGHNACHLKARFTCTLTDIAEPMLALSRTRNPECEHVAGDMRTLRLGRLFDAVLAHDGISYMTSVPDSARRHRDRLHPHTAGRRRDLHAGRCRGHVRRERRTARARRQRAFVALHRMVVGSGAG